FLRADSQALMGASGHSALLHNASTRRPGIATQLRPAGMPPSSRTHRTPVALQRRRLVLAMLFAALLVGPAGADDVPVRSASLRVEDGELLLSAEFDFSLTPALEEALAKGIPLYFTIDFELTRSRFLWFPQKVAQWS